MEAPRVDERHPADVVTAMVARVLALAETWTAWDGEPRPAGDRVYTPHKAVRRVADHLVDHLAEIEARLAGVPTIPDAWHASAFTTPADLAPFTPDDLDEARSRLTRLAQVFDVRLRALTGEELDRRVGDAWSVRQVAFHLEESLYYADAVGDLRAQPRSGRSMRLVTVLDCVDADALADFWSAALGFRRGRFHPPYVRLVDPRERWPNLLLQQVPEPKAGKNRMHLDIQVADVGPEIERLVALGAGVVDEPHDDEGFVTAVLADPQGNEFCVIKPPAGGYDERQLTAKGP